MRDQFLCSTDYRLLCKSSWLIPQLSGFDSYSMRLQQVIHNAAFLKESTVMLWLKYYPL